MRNFTLSSRSRIGIRKFHYSIYFTFLFLLLGSFSSDLEAQTCTGSITAQCNGSRRTSIVRTYELNTTYVWYAKPGDGSFCVIDMGSTCGSYTIRKAACIEKNKYAGFSFSKNSTVIPSFVEADFQEIGISALKAAQLNWILCNYGAPGSSTSSVSEAVWYLTQTSSNPSQGTYNSIVRDAELAVPTPNGTEYGVVFYKVADRTKFPDDQNMVRWECSETTGPPCNLTVDAGADQIIPCASGQAILGATVSNASTCSTDNCCTRAVSNTDACNGSQDFVFSFEVNGSYQFWTDKNLVWKECGNTATLTGQIEKIALVGGSSVGTGEYATVNLTYSGKTTSAPSGSPYSSGPCATIGSTSGWVYYTGLSGTVTKEGVTYNMTRRGPAFQQGNNANLSAPPGYGGEGWFTATGGGASYSGDVNIMLSPTCTPVTTGGENATYAWSTGATTQSIVVSEAGSYSVTATDCKGCTATDVVVVGSSNKTISVSTGVDPTICSGESVQVTVSAVPSGTYTYVWSDGLGTGATKTLSPSATTTYSVTATDAEGCSGVGSVTVNVNEKPSASVSSTAASCGQSDGTITFTFGDVSGRTGIEFSLDGGNTYRPQVNDNIGSVTYSGLSAGTYATVVRWGNDQCPVFVGNAVVGNTTGPTIGTVGKTDVTCKGGNNGSIDLTVSGGTSPYSYAWTDNGTSSSITTQDRTGLGAGTYSVTVTDSKGCTVSTTVTLDEPTEAASATPVNGEICQGDSDGSVSVTPAGVAPYEYLWNTGATTQSLTGLLATTTTTYTVTVTDANGCISTASPVLTVNPSIRAAVTTNEFTCVSQTLVLQGSATGGSGNYSYSWVGPDNFTSTVQNPSVTEPGTYTLTVTDTNTGCVDDVDIILFAEFIPTVVTVSTDICVGESLTLTASGGGTYQWDANANNATTSVVTVSPTTTTTYTVTVTSINGCVNTADVTIKVYEKPEITNVTATGTDACDGGSETGSITVTATGDAGTTLQYRINGGAWQESPSFSNLGAGTYNVEASYKGLDNNAFKCPSDPVQATVSAAAGPTASIANVDAVCANTSFALTASGTGGTAPYTYAWSTTPVQTGETATIADGITEATSYTVTVTDGKGCESTANVTVDVKAGPTVDIDGVPTICAKEGALFTAINAPAGTTFEWIFESATPATSTLSSETPIWDAAGTYKITLRATKDGCTTEKETSINVTQEVFAAAGDSTTICYGASVDLEGSGPVGGRYNWKVVEGDFFSIQAGANTQVVTVNPADTTTYELTVRQNGCTRVDRVTVSVDVNQNPTADAGTDRVECVGEKITLGGAPTGTPPVSDPSSPLQYLWSPSTGLDNNRAANPMVTLDTPGEYTYQVVVVSRSGCRDTSDVTITVSDKAKVGDYVWMDMDYDGVQDGSEMGINGVSVAIYDAATDVKLEETATLTKDGVDGYYEFKVCAGEYYIIFGAVTNKIRTKQNQGDDGTDSDADVSTGRTANFRLNAGDTNMTIDAGYSGIADLKLIKTVDDATPSVGDVVEFTITVTNEGPSDATGVEVTDEVPNGYSNVTSTLGTVSGSTVTFSNLNIAAGASVELRLSATVLKPTAGTSYVNIAEITKSDQYDEDSTPNNGADTDGDGSIGSEDPDGTQDPDDEDDGDDAVVVPSATISGNVSFDTDNNNTGDEPRENVEVVLKDTEGNVVKTTTTDASGNYAFTDVDPGDYVVMVMDAPGTQSVSDVDASVDANDPDGNDGSTPNNAIPVTVTPGEDDENNDFVDEELGSISGNVSEDTNNDDAGEEPLAGIIIKLLDANGTEIARDTTDANGNYEFTDVAPGDYTLMEDDSSLGDTYSDVSDEDESITAEDPDGKDGTVDNMIPVTVTPGEADTDNNFVEEQLGSIGDTVFADVDGDGIQDPEDAGIEGVVVILKDENGTELARDTTDANGNYLFEDLPADRYVVAFENPTGYVVTPQDQGGDDTKDSDIDNTGSTSVIVLAPGEDNLTVDAGYIAPASIGDYVWSDKDQDGIQDADELPIAGVTVQLTDGAGNAVTDITGNPVTDQTTDAAGKYAFTNLKPGDYIVVFVTPEGYTPTTSDVNGGADDATTDDSDPDATGKSDVVNLVSGENESDIDAGYIELGTISGMVTLDNGADANTPLEGVELILKDEDGNEVARDTTDANGNYEFTDVVPGTYTVEETNPTGDYFDVSDVDESVDANDPDGNDGTTPNNVIPVTVEPGEDDENNDFVEDLLQASIVLEKATNGVDADTPAEAPVIPIFDGSTAPVKWTYEVTNDGNVDLTNVVITDDKEGSICTIPLLKVGETQTCEKTADAVEGAYTNVGTATGQPVDPTTGDPIGEEVEDTDPSNYLGFLFNIDKTADKDTICSGEEVEYTVAVRNRNGVPLGISIENIRLYDNQLPGQVLTVDSPEYQGVNDLTVNDTVVGKEYIFKYTMVITETTLNKVTDSFDLHVNGLYNQTLSSMDSVEVIVDESKCAKLGDIVFEDVNGDGLQDADEPGIEGVSVTLLDGAGNPTGETATTDANGMYMFGGLAPGDYQVQFTEPTGYVPTTQNAGDDTKDSDANPTDGKTQVVTLANGDQDLTLDAGYIAPASLGDYVWSDKDRDGIQDAEESPISGVTVQLTDASGNAVTDINGDPVADQTTDAAGKYMFTNLKPGDYVVVFVTPEGYTPTTSDVNGGADDATTDDSDPDATGKSDVVNLVSGENESDIDAGYIELGSISGTVTEDTNNDDAGEEPLAGIIIKLLDENGDEIARDTTDANGNYEFTELPAGEYTVVEDDSMLGDTYSDVSDEDESITAEDPDGNDGATPNNEIPVTLAPGENDTDNNFVEEQLGSIGDTVFADKDADGIQDPEDAGIEGVVVILKDENGTELARDTTDANGKYLFEDLPAGSYVVAFENPTGYVVTPQDQGGDDASDSDIDNTGSTSVIVLGAGEDNVIVDAGYYVPASIGDYVWLDTNKDGKQGAEESGVEGVVVKLMDSAGNPVTDANGDVVADQTTDANGSYLFDNLVPGDYVVVFTAIEGSTLTTQDVDGNNTDATDVGDDSDANPVSGRSHVVTLESGEAERKVDAGIYYNLSLGNLVWEDINNDGDRDAGEPGIDGVTVGLFKYVPTSNGGYNTEPVMTTVDAGGVMLEVPYTVTTTDGGAYLFTDLEPGDYVVSLVNNIPAGYLTSTGNDPVPSPNDGVDNDDNGSVLAFAPTEIRSGVVNLTETNLRVDFGLYKSSSIGDYVWNDKNGDGVQDADEPGIDGVLVRLYKEENGSFKLIESVYTMENPENALDRGYYSFDSLQEGRYYVEFEKPDTFDLTSPVDVESDVLDSDIRTISADGKVGSTDPIVLGYGERNADIDAGYYRTGKLGDYVWIDEVDKATYPTTNLALQDISTTENRDLPYEGVKVTLIRLDKTVTEFDPNKEGTEWDRIGVRYTDASGKYLFDSLPQGNYVLEFEQPQDSVGLYSFVSANGETNTEGITTPEIDSDVAFVDGPSELGVRGRTIVINFGEAETNLTVDAGYLNNAAAGRALPVEWVSFTGEYNGTLDQNELEWVTASELNSSHYEVERSIDGVTFEQIGRVASVGTTNEESRYAYNDEELGASGVYYYRLKQVDFDGRYAYSTTIAIEVNRGVDAMTRIYPNPAVSYFNVALNVPKGETVRADLVDASGRLVRSNILGAVEIGRSEVKVEVEDLLAGVYYVRVTIGTTVSNHKLLVVR